MQTIKRIRGSEDDLGFEVDLIDIKKTLTDVDDIYFTIKEDASDDDDSLFLKSRGAGGITASGTNQLVVGVQWDYNEYDDFVIGKTYIAGLFVKFTGDENANENVDQIFHLVITDDLLKQN